MRAEKVKELLYGYDFELLLECSYEISEFCEEELLSVTDTKVYKVWKDKYIK